MRTKFLLLIFFLVGIKVTLKAESFSLIETDSAFYFSSFDASGSPPFESEQISFSHDKLSHFQSSELALKYKNAFKENKRLTAAMLTFALGMLGVHRLYLGTQPWIPAVYLFTFGGGFLILPLIDLGVILFCKDISKYEHNDKVLMWVK